MSLRKGERDYCSPSQLSRRYACPGSVRLEQSMEKPDRSEDSKASTEGKQKHDQVQGRSHTELVAAGASEDVLWCALQRDRIIDDLKKRYGDVLVLEEHQIDLSELGIMGGKHGNRIDCLIVVPGILCVVVDYKFGVGYVSPVRYNWQFKAYAWGAMDAFGGAIVRGVKLQPNEPSGRYFYSEHAWDQADIELIGQEIKDIVEKTKDPDAPLVLGSQCNFCTAKDVCPLWRNTLMSMPTHVSVASYLTNIEPAQRTDLYETLLRAKTWVENALKAYDAAVLKDGLELPGYEAGLGRGTRAWGDEWEATTALRMLALELEKDPESIMISKVVSPAEAEVLFGKSKAIREYIAQYTESLPGKPKIVRQKGTKEDV